MALLCLKKNNKNFKNPEKTKQRRSVFGRLKRSPFINKKASSYGTHYGSIGDDLNFNLVKGVNLDPLCPPHEHWEIFYSTFTTTMGNFCVFDFPRHSSAVDITQHTAKRTLMAHKSDH